MELQEIIFRARHRRVIFPKLLDEAWLREQYEVSKRPIKEIARDVGCNPKTVSEALKRAGISLRHPRFSAAPRRFYDRWNGERYVDRYGYVYIWVGWDYPNACNGYYREHRYVMEQRLRRHLSPTEFVHHINGIKDDNRIENLRLVSRAEHQLYSELCRHCPLRKEVRLLRKELKGLKQQVQSRLM